MTMKIRKLVTLLTAVLAVGGAASTRSASPPVSLNGIESAFADFNDASGAISLIESGLQESYEGRTRMDSAALGNFGDCQSVGDGVSEMRIHFGPGYRVYFTRRGMLIYVLLIGGDKSTQKRDIKRALKIARELKT